MHSGRGRSRSPWVSATSSGRAPGSPSRWRSCCATPHSAGGFLYACAAALFAGIRINIDPAFGTDYLLSPIAAVVIAGAALSGGLASATSTWIAALALTLLPHMLRILGLKTAMQYVAFGGAIIAG